MESLGRKLAGLAARTDFMPFSLIYEFIYQLGIWYLAFRLRAISAVRGVYLSGSAAIKDMCHGVSDVDFFIVIGSEDKDNTSARTALKAALADVIAVFPFMGPYEERRDGIVVVDDKGAADLLIFSYRRKTCLFKPLFERCGFTLRKDGEINPIEILSELNNLVARLIRGIRDQRLDAYFWKTKLRSLLVALSNQPTPHQNVDSLGLTEDERDLLLYLWKTPNFRLITDLSEKRTALAYRVFWKLIEQVIEKYQFEELPETQVPFSTVQQLPIRSRQYAIKNDSFQEIAVSNFALAGLAVLDDLPTQLGSVDLREADYHQVIHAVRETEKLDFPCNFNFNRFIVRSFGKEAGAGNVYTAPFAFTNANQGSWPIKTIVLERMVDEAKMVKSELLKRYRQFLAKSTPSEVAAEIGSEPHLMVGEDDYQVILSLLQCLRLSKLTDKSVKVYRSNDEVFAELAGEYPQYGQFIEILNQYFEALKKQEFQFFNQLPSNTFGFMVKFFLGALKEGSMPPLAELHKKLTLSLCICTKDRPKMLADLLSSVAVQTRKPDQLVLVDNSQSSQTLEVAQQFKDKLPIEYVRDMSASLPALRNKAIASSTGEIICFTDDDCVLDKNWLAAVERSFLRSEEIGAVGGIVRHLDTQSGSAAELFYQQYLGRVV
jgi:hypothetical protein